MAWPREGVVPPFIAAGQQNREQSRPLDAALFMFLLAQSRQREQEKEREPYAQVGLEDTIAWSAWLTQVTPKRIRAKYGLLINARMLQCDDHI